VKALRPHQTAAHDLLRAGFRRGKRRGLLVMPTGAGKTVTALEILRLAQAQGRRGLFLCDRRVLVGQAAREAREYGIDCGVLMRDAGPLYRNPEAPIQFASKDTMLSWMASRRDFDLPPSDLVVTDEAHRSAAQTWEALLAAFPAAWEVGLTATPARSDSKGLGNRYEFLCQPTSYSALIAAGVLVPARCFAPGSKVQADRRAAKRPRRADLVGDVVGWWERLARGKRTFVFASGVRHSLALRDEFLKRGYAADHLDGDTPDDERDAVLSRAGRLATGRTLVVCSCSVLKYGVDVPSVECVQLADGFGSLVDYLQACGRGLRASPGKEACTVIDHAGAVLYHGFPDADRPWALAETLDHSADWQAKVAAGTAPKPQVCPHCACVFAARPDCPACGWRPKREPKPTETNKGQLFEVERAAAAAFTPDDYRKGWAQCVAQAHHTGKSLSAAAAVFKRRFDALPWAVRAEPLPPAGYNWHRPASDWWRAAFVSSKAS
jgi:superfamily II DNA or RNA helicase